VPRREEAEDVITLVHYYIAQEGLGNDLEVISEGDNLGFDDIKFRSKTQGLGDYTLLVTQGTGEHPSSDHELSGSRRADKTALRSLKIPDEIMWQAKNVVYRQLSDSVQFVQENYAEEDPPPAWQVYKIENRPDTGNVHIIQKVFQGAFEFDVIFSSGSAGKELTSEDVTREVKSTSESFNERFSSVFDLKAPFNAQKYKKFAKSMFSNLIGGIGYFHGQHLVDRSYAAEYDEENEGFWEDAAAARARQEQKLEGPYELFTSIPSRPFFPRGFLWDEGFHLIPIADWDIDLTLEIVKSWFNLMDDDGWIAREQILGAEARSKVPEEFQVQYPHYANPPTLFLIIEGFMERLKKSNGSQQMQKEHLSQDIPLRTAHADHPEVGAEFLRRIYPLLRRQYEWFRRTQRGDIKSYDREAFSKKEAYRWKGRTETHCLTSGLDDYPRASPPHPGELHVDLMSWVGLMTKSLLNIADALGMQEDVQDYKRILAAIENNLKDLHWSEKEGCFCDATIDSFEEHSLICHKGYISLFPFLLGLMKPDDKNLGKLLDLIGDEEELFSPHGLRSLSKKDEFYGTAENYWRSPIWININYLAITQLRVSIMPSYAVIVMKDS
jgi:mannosyl-oligosaccharide glucosidase